MKVVLRKPIARARRRHPSPPIPAGRSTDLNCWNAVRAEMARVRATQRKRIPDRDLVMGLATNYTIRELGPFVRSLRASGYDGDVVLWTLETDPATAAFLRANRIRQELFWEGQFLPMTPMLARFFCYYRLLRALDRDGHRYRRVFLTDVRDVVFQGNPFDVPMRKDVLAFLEHPAQTIGGERINSTWVRQGFGEKTLKQIGKRHISCAGTLLATWQGMLNYLLTMQLCAYECAPDARTVYGIDQAIHNVLLRTGRLGDVTFVANAKHVWTLHFVPATEIFITPQRRIVDGSGRVCPVIHQYNRHPILSQLVAEQFGDAAKIRP